MRPPQAGPVANDLLLFRLFRARPERAFAGPVMRTVDGAMRKALATEVAQRASGGYCLLAGMTAAAASGRRRRDQIAHHLPQRHKLRRESSKTANAEHAAEIATSAPTPRRVSLWPRVLIREDSGLYPGG